MSDEAEPNVESAATDADENTESKKTETQPFDESDLLEEYMPVPYLFRIRDARGKRISLPPDRLTNARIECPPFHVLLDHLIAVLWAYYSKNGIELLESSQLHWAIKILEGTKTKHAQYTDDVQMAINHLTDAFMNVCSAADLSTLDNRIYYPMGEDETNTSVDGGNDSSPKADNETTENSKDGYKTFKTGLNNLSDLRNTSIHLADMLSDEDPLMLEELMASQEDPTVSKEGGVCIQDMASKINEEGLPEEQKNILVQRNTMFQNVIGIIEEIRRLDETLSSIPNQVALPKLPSLSNTAEEPPPPSDE